MNTRTNSSPGERWSIAPTADRNRRLPPFLTAPPVQPQQSNPSGGSYLRLAVVVCTAAVVTGALTVDWPRVISEFAGAQVGAVANRATTPASEAAVPERPVMVKTTAIGPIQLPKAEAPAGTNLAAAKAQLARDLAQPEFGSEGASRPTVQEAAGIASPRPSETTNLGAAPSDRGHAFEPKLAPRTFDAAVSQQLIRRAEELVASGDIAAARLILQRLAEANEQRAALLLAGTYDPLVLEKLRVYAFASDVAKARSWYEKAREMGSPEASRRLELLAQLIR